MTLIGRSEIRTRRHSLCLFKLAVVQQATLPRSSLTVKQKPAALVSFGDNCGGARGLCERCADYKCQGEQHLSGPAGQAFVSPSRTGSTLQIPLYVRASLSPGRRTRSQTRSSTAFQRRRRPAASRRQVCRRNEPCHNHFSLRRRPARRTICPARNRRGAVQKRKRRGDVAANLRASARRCNHTYAAPLLSTYVDLDAKVTPV